MKCSNLHINIAAHFQSNCGHERNFDGEFQISVCGWKKLTVRFAHKYRAQSHALIGTVNNRRSDCANSNNMSAATRHLYLCLPLFRNVMFSYLSRYNLFSATWRVVYDHIGHRVWITPVSALLPGRVMHHHYPCDASCHKKMRAGDFIASTQKKEQTLKKSDWRFPSGFSWFRHQKSTQPTGRLRTGEYAPCSKTSQYYISKVIGSV